MAGRERPLGGVHEELGVEMTTNHVRRYDVAISFLAEDERVAMSLATALKKHWTVFIYTERQKELAGTDGVEAFSRVFKEDCWLCVILFRDGWGETKWTPIEASAIREHGLKEGWQILIVVTTFINRAIQRKKADRRRVDAESLLYSRKGVEAAHAQLTLLADRTLPVWTKSADLGQRISSKQLADWCLQRLLDRDLPDRD